METKRSKYGIDFSKYKNSKKGALIGKSILPIVLAVCTFAAMCVGCGSFFISSIPSQISVFSENDIHNLDIPFISFEKSGDSAAVGCLAASDDESGPPSRYTVNYQATIFSKIPLKDVSVNVLGSDIELCPGGMNFGVMLNTKGVLIVGMSDISSNGVKSNPAYNAGMRIKDVITAINGTEVNSVEEIIGAVRNCSGNKLHFDIMRDNQSFSCDVTPIKGDGDGEYKLGLWIRDSTAGIGTVTFIMPDLNIFAGLGHGIYDVDTSQLLPMLEGNVSEVKISGISKGRPGSPGELRGSFYSGRIGSLLKNSETGVYGIFSELPDCVDKNERMHIALKDDIREGDAVIRCSVDGELREYNVTLSQISRDNRSYKNFIVEVTDPALIELTGGIVQGMSGSPVIQDGKLIGAVTHVMINSPTTGYGIFIENMLNNLPNIG